MHLSQVPLQQSPAAVAQQRHAVAVGATPNRRSSSSSSDLLQTKLRKLLNTSDSKETITADMLAHSSASNTPNTPGTFSYTSPKIHEQVGIIAGEAGEEQIINYSSFQLSIQPETHNDVSVFFPSAFLSPQSLPPHPASDEDIYTYGIDDSLVLTDDYRAISPPSEYAANTPSDHHHGGGNQR